MGIETVAVYSEADKDLAVLGAATESVCIGGTKSYLDQDAILLAGETTRCSAVHPGWGFLSENPTFAARCEASRMTFVGPRANTMRRMANKAAARDTMRTLGVSPTPGSDGVVATVDDAIQTAEQIGYPILLKALSGGGGRGMRKVMGPDEMAAAFAEATAEAAGAFGDGRLYLEKLIVSGRHIEFQLLGDGKDVVVLGARECSVQRRHQKLLEETPSTALDDDGVRQLADRIASACRTFGYRGAGTMEMLRDDDGSIYFMEMNTRLQVEHTVTEMVTGMDLVEAQLRLAANQSLERACEASRVGDAQGGHSIQCRINAEDPAHGFRPSPGQLRTLRWPEGDGLRVDTHLCEGDRMSPHYDSMLGKVIAHGADRAEAIARMTAGLKALKIEGVLTTVPFHLAVLAHPEFVSGNYDTRFVERELETLLA